MSLYRMVRKVRRLCTVMNLKEWKRKIAERNDMTSYLIHLTKNSSENSMSTVQVLVKILSERKLTGSTTESGFVVGDIKAVCLQECPLYSLTQNIFYEQKLRENNELKKIRYLGFGIMFEKMYLYNKGARPVIYDKTVEAKSYLPKEQWWRIVNLDLSNENKIIDWTHEREWRIPNELEFELKDISVIVPNYKAFRAIISMCSKVGIDLTKEVKSIINLGDLFY